MNEYQKEFEYYLRYLSKQERQEELTKYQNINEKTDLVELANNIYAEKGLKTRVLREIKFTEAINIIIDKTRENNKDIGRKLLLFILYILFLIIIIKVPFIYTRDITNNLFNELINTDKKIMIWNLIFEALYAVTTILILIRLIKKKALEIEKM